MSLVVKNNTGGDKFQTVQPGTYPARCIRIIDIGTQEAEYQGEKKKQKQLIITWELPTELITSGDFAGQPIIISKFFTASLHEKAGLRKALEAWRGSVFTDEELKGFHLKAFLDKCCLLNVIHTASGNAKVNGIMALPKGMTLPDRVCPLILFDLENFDDAVYALMSAGIKKLIDQSAERKFGTAHSIDTAPYEEAHVEPF